MKYKPTYPCPSCKRSTSDNLQEFIPRVGTERDPPTLRMVGLCQLCLIKHRSLEYYSKDAYLQRSDSEKFEEASELMDWQVFECGGVLAGSWAVKIIGAYNWEPGDVDVFFHSPADYADVRDHMNCGNLVSDPQFTFVGHSPVYTRFDLDLTMCSISKEGIFIDERCSKVMSGVKEAEIVMDNVVEPILTWSRVQKYQRRGFRFNQSNLNNFLRRYPNVNGASI